MKALTTFAAIALSATTLLAAPPVSKVIYEAPARAADDDMVIAYIDLDQDIPGNYEIRGIYAMESTGADNSLYQGYSELEEGGGHIFRYDLPPGTYDFYLGLEEADFKEAIILTSDGQKITGGETVTVRASSATHETQIRHIGPDGKEMKFKYTRSGTLLAEGTIANGQLLQCLQHGDNYLRSSSLSTDSENLTSIRCNNPASRFVTTRIDVMMTPHGWLNAIIPLDYESGISSTDGSGWVTASEKFAPTPANITATDYFKSTNPDYAYCCSLALILFKDTVLLTTGLGSLDPQIRSDVVGVWQPASYTGQYEALPIACGASIKGWDSGTCGLPMRLADGKLVQAGLNILPGRNIFLYTGETSAIGPENPVFSGSLPTTELGNCAPMLIFCPEEEYFEFFYTGRHGESICQAREYYTLPSIEYWDGIFGKQLCDVKFYRDDKLICDSRRDFPYDADWGPGGVYRIEINTDNVLVDGEIAGFTNTVSVFDTDKGPWIPPTLTSLRIVDSDGKINDHLTEVAGAKISFTGGLFEYRDNWTARIAYAEFSPVECVSVEYAPNGSDNFIPLEATECGDELPGYGSAFEASLENVDATSANRWYDLRITIADANGATHSQTLSPAFRVGPPASIEAIPAGNAANPAEIYTLQGLRVSDMDTPGIYIVRTADGKFCKVLK